MNHVIEPTPDGLISKGIPHKFNWDIAPGSSHRRTGGGAGTGPANGGTSWAGKPATSHGPVGIMKMSMSRRQLAGDSRSVISFLRRVVPIPRRPAQPGAIPAEDLQPIPANHHARAPCPGRKLRRADAAIVALGHGLSGDRTVGRQLWPRAPTRAMAGARTARHTQGSVHLRTPSFAGATGHDQLVRLGQIQPRGPDFVRHYLTNHVIEPMPGGAKGRVKISRRHRRRLERQSELVVSRRPLRRHVRGRRRKAGASRTRRLFPPRSGPQDRTVAQTAPPPPAASAAPIAGKAAGTAAVAAPASSLSAVGRDARASRSNWRDQDIIVIQQLIARSAYALDSAADQGAAFTRSSSRRTERSSTKTVSRIEIRGRAQLAAFAVGDLVPPWSCVCSRVFDQLHHPAVARVCDGRVCDRRRCDRPRLCCLDRGGRKRQCGCHPGRRPLRRRVRQDAGWLANCPAHVRAFKTWAARHL